MQDVCGLFKHKCIKMEQEKSKRCTKFAILAAGEGSRLAQEGVELPKPLVKINGEAMIDRLIRIFNGCGAEEIFIITNNLTPLTQNHLRDLQNSALAPKNGIKLIVKTTPSSMHSFYELRQIMGDGKFCLTTVDTIFREAEFKEYIDAWSSSGDDGMMAVTDYIDDEKPLYIGTDSNLGITGFYDTEAQKYISGGIYCLSETSFPVIDKCISEGQSRMRNFQRQLVKDGLRLKAYPFSKILDVDHASDIEKAEEFTAMKEGISYTSKVTVSDSLLAQAMGSGDMPVFATPAMMALMENAAMNCVAPYMQIGMTTVGGHIESSHLAPSPLDAEITATATLTKIDGKKLFFDVKAEMDGKLIGEGKHLRFIVPREKFLSKIYPEK